MSAHAIARTAKAAFEASQLCDEQERTKALHTLQEELTALKDDILDANKRDLAAAREQVQTGALSDALLKRLDLSTEAKWSALLQGVADVAALPAPTDKVTYATRLDDGLELFRVTCPIGVLLVIFEARPEVVVNIAALAIKSGNAAILKGGKESAHTARVLARAIHAALARTALPPDYVQTVETRADVAELLAEDTCIDLVIPRGGKELVRSVQRATRIPVMGHADGLCTVYLDASADPAKAVRVVLDSKLDYPAACNAVETLLIHETLLKTLWPTVAAALLEKDVMLLCDEASRAALPAADRARTKSAPADAFDTEHLSRTLSVRAVASLETATAHINEHASHHTDAIVTEDERAAARFCRGVASAGTFVNASTRFADGFRYGFGTEVGIATGRVHARGPVGLDGLVSYKYMLRGAGVQGHVVGEFGDGKKQFLHERIDAAAPPY